MPERQDTGPTPAVERRAQTFGFRRYDRIVINGVNYLWANTTQDAHTFMREDDGLSEVFGHDHIERLISKDALEFYAAFHHPGRKELRHRNGGLCFGDLSRNEQDAILFRRWICDRFLERERTDSWVARSDKKMLPVIREMMQVWDQRNRENGAQARCGQEIGQQPKEPHPRTLKRWLKAYEWSGYDPMALRSNYRRPSHGSQLSPEAYEVHAHYVWIYASSKKPSMYEAWRRLSHYIDELNAEREPAEQIEKLSRRSFERMIKRLDPVHVATGREGRDAARKKWRPANGGLDVLGPFDRLEMDEYKTDLQTILVDADVWQYLPDTVKAKVPRTRIWISAAIDACSRVVPAIRFMTEHPSEASAVTTLEMAVSPNHDIEETVGAATSFPCGTPQEIATDSGASYVSKGFQYRVLELGATSVLPPAGIPELRGKIERVFKTCRQRILQHFSGQTFHNVVEKGDADPEADASLVVAEFNRLLARGVLDEYHNTPHAGIGGATPLTYFRWMGSFSGPMPPPTGAHRRHVFGVPCNRRIAQEGVLVAGVRYQSDELQRLRRKVGQQEVNVRIDRFDLSSISVWHPFLGGWLSVPARFNGLENVSYWEWCDVVEDLKRKFADHAQMNQSVVRQAIRDRERKAAGAEAIAGVTTMLTEAELHRSEREVFGNFGVALKDDKGPGLGFTSAVTDDAADTMETLPKTAAADTLPTGDALPTPPDGAAALPAPDTENPDGEDTTAAHQDPGNGGEEDEGDDDDLFGTPDDWTSR